MEYKVTDEEMQQIPGCTPLKIYIVLNNSPNGATAAMLANQLHAPKSSLFRGLSIVSKAGLLSKNGNVYSRIRDSSLTFGKEKEKKQKKKEISETMSNFNSTSSLYIGDEVLFGWLTADAEQLHNLCQYLQLLPTGKEGAAAELEALRPYMEVFIQWLRSRGDNLAEKGAEDTRRHFAKWLSGQVTRKKAAEERAALNAAKSKTRPPRGQPQTLTEEQQQEQMLQKQRRLEKAEEEQRRIDAQRRAAEQDTDTEARDRIFARLGLK